MWDKLLSMLGGNLFTGVAEIIKTFVADPTKQAEAMLQIETLKINTMRDIYSLEVADRDSARKREAAVGDKTTRNLAYLYTIGYFGMLAMLLTGNVVVPDSQKVLLDVLLGVLTAGQYSVMQYYFGSSHGSSEKNHLINTVPK